MSNAPIIVFAYKRPDHLRRAIDSLRANPEAAQSALVIACDGPKRLEDEVPCTAVQEYAHGVRDGFKSVEVRVSPRNLGLAASLTAGVSAMLQQHERAIVVEDDLELSPHFLRYMNDGLHVYANDEQVASIHGYCPPVDVELPDTFFLKGADCWGWATWARAWAHFQPDGNLLLNELIRRKLTREFDFDGAYPYTQMLRDQISGRNNSWAIRWLASAYLRDMLTLYPGRSLVVNVGFDGSGTHCESSQDFDQVLTQSPVHVQRITLAQSAAARDAVKRHFLNATGNAPAIWRRLYRKTTAWLRT